MFYVDNDSAREAIIRGSSAAPDMAAKAFQFWELAMLWRCRIWVMRVASAANVSDEISRAAFPTHDPMGKAYHGDAAVMLNDS